MNEVQKLILNESINLVNYKKLRGSSGTMWVMVTFEDDRSFLLGDVYNQTINKKMNSDLPTNEMFEWLRKYMIKNVHKFSETKMDEF